MLTGRLRRRLVDESGAIWVWLALMMPVAAVLAAFVVDVANWFEHERHLQTQVDAAALAGGGGYVFTATTTGTTCNNASIEGLANAYAGDPTNPTYGGSLYNLQVGGEPNKVHVLYNSPDYWSSGGANANDGLGGPCSSNFIDVKATDHSPKLFFASLFPGLAPDIHAHARVDFLLAQSVVGSFPLALPDPTPRAARAYFVDLSNGNFLMDPANPGQKLSLPLFFASTDNANSTDYWTSVDTSIPPPGAPVYRTLTIPSSVTSSVGNHEIGIRVALSYDPSNTDCPATSALVTCWDPGSGNPNGDANSFPNTATTLYGVDPIRVYDNTARPQTTSPRAALVIYGAKLTTTNCGNGTALNAYFTTTDCSVSLHIRASLPDSTSTPASTISLNKVSMWARLDGSKQNGDQKKMVQGSSADCPPIGPNDSPAGSVCWESQQPIPVTGPGWHTIDVVWQDSTAGENVGGQDCKATSACDDSSALGGTSAQRIFEASQANAGQLLLVDTLDSNQIQAETSGSLTSHSVAAGTSLGPIGVKIGLPQAFATQSVIDPATGTTRVPVVLRAATSQGSFFVDCNPSTGPLPAQFQAQYNLTGPQYNNYTSRSGELQFGCLPTYTKWDGAAACPGASPPPYPGSRSTLWNSTAMPWYCVAQNTGLTAADIGQGLNGRFNNGSSTTCVHPNNWDPGGSTTWTPDQLPKNDPRNVILMLSPYGAFSTTGNGTYPVTRFAGFYITGWQGNGGNPNPCLTPPAGTPKDDNATSGQIVGHFITYLENFNSGGGDPNVHCPGGVDVCVAVLTQ